MMHEALQKVVAGKDLGRQEAFAVMNAIMSGQASEAQIAALLVAMRMKGETAAEVAGFAQAMRDKATAVPTHRKDAIDLCGTGGDGRQTFNISTIASFAVAGAGVPVAKHGNRSVSSLCGSADVLAALGININLSAEQMGRCLDELGIAFLFAPVLHSAMKYAAPTRKAIGIKTVFNILGPITNPAGVKRQLIGVFDRKLATLLASVLKELGTSEALVVHGEDGTDEVTLQGCTFVVQLKEGRMSEFCLAPADFGLPLHAGDGLSGGSASYNAQMALRVLRGESGPLRDTVMANAACGLLIAGAANDLQEAMNLGRTSIDSGAALAKLEDLRRFSQSMVG